MAGIYIHIPFCKSRCIYCDFFSTTDTFYINKFVDAICYELFLRKNEALFEIKTIYIGGGTPSLLNEEHLEKIFNSLHKHYSLHNVKEITIEVNPDDITIEKLHFYKKLGINRLSFGVQSFDDNITRFLSRRHNAKQSIDAILTAFNVGIENISIDLMYGISGLTEETWINTLQTSLKLNVKHISAYHLTMEENTLLYKSYMNKDYIPIDEENSVKQYQILCNFMKEAKFEHYEISNYALTGYKSVHNSSYWELEPYMGIGPSAHSYLLNKRRSNINSLELYTKNVFKNKDYYEETVLSKVDIFNEYIMVKLRTKEGIILSKIPEIEEKLFTKFLKNVSKLKEDGLLTEKNNNLYINEKNWFLSDYVIRELFV
jgi:oxygen-independent coproporphyrinogen-3 oxidase